MSKGDDVSSVGINQLQDVVNSTSKSASLEARILKLTNAFNLFSKETCRLEKAYESLQDRFEMVSEQLEQSNRKLNGILSYMSQGIFFINLKGVVTIYNMAAEKIVGKDRKEVLFKNVKELFNDDLFGFSLLEALGNRAAPEATMSSIPQQDNEFKEVEVTTSFVLDGPEEHQGLILLLRDITEIRRLQSLANRNDRLKELGEMAASVAHEIRNPLGGIEGFAHLLNRDLKDLPESQAMTRQIIDGTKTLNKLVTQVLNYARPVKMQRERIDLITFIKETVAFLEVDRSFSQKIQYKIKSDAKEIFYSLDVELFRSALFNLLVNAADSMPNGGDVLISLREERKNIQMEICDEGEGIPSKNLEKIFSPFFTTKHNGNGFGLSEVYKVIQAHGGAIDVSSEEGNGTCIGIKLPIRKG